MGHRATSEDPLESSPIMVTLAYVLITFLAWFFYAVLHHWWGGHMLMSIDRLTSGSLSGAALGKVWLLFVWGLVASLVLVCIGSRPVSYQSRAVQFLKGLWVSLNAGVFEELVYRVFLFLSTMVILPFLSTITFGLVHWLYATIFVPLANMATLHLLSPELTGHHGWVFGAAIVSAAFDFSDDHEHLGPIGQINAWFMGMVFFYLILNYGLLTAIVAHVLYDVIVFTVRACTSDVLTPTFALRKPGRW